MAEKLAQADVRQGARRGGKAGMLACALCCGCALALVLAGSIVTVGFREMPDFFVPDVRVPLALGISLSVCAAVSLAAYALLANFSRLMAWADSKNPVPRLRLELGPGPVLAVTAVILVCWLPYLVLQFPCAMNGDTYNQLYQFQTSDPTLYSTIGLFVDESYVDHHPVFDTLLFGCFLSLGDALGSQNAGLFAYSLFQSALVAVGLALSCCYMERLGVPKVFRLVTCAFVALFPVFPMWSATMLKDPLNAALFIYLMLLVVEGVRTRGAVFDRWQMVVAYVIVASLCILTKKSSFLIVFAGTLALALYARPAWKAMLVNLIAPLVISLAIVPALLYPAIGGVAAGGKQEAFGFAFQQVITALLEEDDMTDSEREAVGAVLDVEAAEGAYRPSIVDPVKRKANVEATTGDYLGFVGAYFSIGLRHPAAYTASILNVCGTLIAPGRAYTFFVTPTQEQSWIDMFEHADKSGELHLDFEKPAALEAASAAFDKAWRGFVAALGPAQAPFDAGFYGGWIPLLCLVLCLYGRRADAVALVPVIAACAIVVISPASSTRYALPMLFTTPLMLGLACHALRTRFASWPAAAGGKGADGGRGEAPC